MREKTALKIVKKRLYKYHFSFIKAKGKKTLKYHTNK